MDVEDEVWARSIGIDRIESLMEKGAIKQALQQRLMYV